MKEPIKRQARGLARMQSLLEAAEIVFARVGYSKATTNEIAAEAGVSPATLYQFFSNKEELANALAMHYAEQLSQLNDRAEINSLAKMDTDEMVRALLNPLLHFHKEHKAFMSLLLDAPLSDETKAAKRAISEKFINNTAKLLRIRNEKLSSSQARWKAEIVLLIYKGFLNELQSAEKDRRKKLVATLRHSLELYLDSGAREL